MFTFTMLALARYTQQTQTSQLFVLTDVATVTVTVVTVTVLLRLLLPLLQLQILLVYCCTCCCCFCRCCYRAVCHSSSFSYSLSPVVGHRHSSCSCPVSQLQSILSSPTNSSKNIATFGVFMLFLALFHIIVEKYNRIQIFYAFLAVFKSDFYSHSYDMI